MKKLSNKGMTLIELIVSVALISIIMLFMYKLISDVRNEKKDNDKLTNNIITISEIIVDLENRLTNNDILKIQFDKYDGEIIIYYTYEKNADYLVKVNIKSGDDATTIDINTLKEEWGEFKKILELEKKWTIKNLTVDMDNIEIKKDSDDNLKFINFIIPLKDSDGKIISKIELPYYDSGFAYSF